MIVQYKKKDGEFDVIEMPETFFAEVDGFACKVSEGLVTSIIKLDRWSYTVMRNSVEDDLTEEIINAADLSPKGRKAYNKYFRELNKLK